MKPSMQTEPTRQFEHSHYFSSNVPTYQCNNGSNSYHWSINQSINV